MWYRASRRVEMRERSTRSESAAAADGSSATIERTTTAEAGRRRGRLVHLLAVAGPRELFYRTALGTGLRRLELGRLTWGDLVLDEHRPHVALRTEATKSRRADIIPLSPALADRLRSARPAVFRPTDPVFVTIPA